MGTELATKPESPKQITITVTNETVTELRAKAAAVRIAGIKVDSDGSIIVSDPDAMLLDKDGLKAVKTMRMTAVKARTTCEKEHKVIKEDALKECQRIDQSRRTLVSTIESIEKPLLEMENAVETELDRRAKEKADRIYAKRREELIAKGERPEDIREDVIRRMDEDAFANEVRRVFEVNQRRIAEEQERLRKAEELRLETERLAKEREELANLRAEQERLAQIERDRLHQEQQKQQRLLQEQNDRLQKLRDEHAEQVLIAAEKAERERLEAANRVALEEQRLNDARREIETRQLAQAAEQERIEQLQRASIAPLPPVEVESKEHENVKLGEFSCEDGIDLSTTVDKVEDSTNWHQIAAKDVCEWWYDKSGMAYSRIDVECVTDLILAAFQQRIV